MNKGKFILLGTTLTAILASCMGVDAPTNNDVTKKAEYKAKFVKEFGEIPANQSWDFYQQLVSNASTKAEGDVTIDNTIGQPADLDFNEWQNKLKSGADNRNAGTHDFRLFSPGNGKFKVYAIWYAGWYATYSKFDFELGMKVDGTSYKIFDGSKVDGAPVYDPTGKAFSKNPGYGADIYVPTGKKVTFYIKYTDGTTQTRYSDQGNATLLYSDLIAVDKQVMVVGFEDKAHNSDGTWPESPDFNDAILYIEGNPDLPVPEAKRFMCEDLGTIGDFDFNDVVFDIQPAAETNKAIVTIQAAGGTLPITLYINNSEIGNIHSLFGVSDKTMVNTGGATADKYHKIITVPSDFDIATFDDFYFKVTDTDGTERTIGMSKTGEAPCIIAVPISTKWPAEYTNIKSAYPDFFTGTWYNNYNSSKLYDEK